MRTKRLRWLGVCGLVGIGTVLAAWAMLHRAALPPGELQAAQYRTGRNQTARGRVIPLPNARFWVTEHAYYTNGGARILVYAVGGNPNAGTPDASGGYWLLDPASGTGRLIHDNFDGSLWSGVSLSRLEGAKPSPDGRYVAAFRKSYSEAARAIRADDPEPWGAMENALQSFHWELIEVESGSRTLLMDLTDEQRTHAYVRQPRAWVWLDNERLAFVPPAADWADPDGTRICTLHVPSRRIEAVITEAPGSYIAHLRRVSEGKLLYHVQSFQALEKAAAYRKATILSPRDEAVVRRLDEADSSLKLADLRTTQPVVRTLEFANPDVNLRGGFLSPDERYYAFQPLMLSPDGKLGRGLAITSLQTGRLVNLDGEINALRGWHPDGSRLLAVLSPEEPTDAPGVLVEIPVADVCQSLK